MDRAANKLLTKAEKPYRYTEGKNEGRLYSDTREA
jgi:hypothetical protein